MMHDYLLGAYRGAGTITQKIRERYYWETVYQDCKAHVKTCRGANFKVTLRRIMSYTPYQ